MEKHNINPIYNQDSTRLILGSFPSVKSREGQFFYHHPQNRFWKILEQLYHTQLTTIEEKTQCLLDHHIAVWDVIQSCTIQGSSDSSIKDIQVNDVCSLIKQSKITKIYTNGNKATTLYKKYLEPLTHIPSIPLPSTSPANAAYSLERLLKDWEQIKE